MGSAGQVTRAGPNYDQSVEKHLKSQVKSLIESNLLDNMEPAGSGSAAGSSQEVPVRLP